MIDDRSGVVLDLNVPPRAPVSSQEKILTDSASSKVSSPSGEVVLTEPVSLKRNFLQIAIDWFRSFFAVSAEVIPIPQQFRTVMLRGIPSCFDQQYVEDSKTLAEQEIQLADIDRRIVEKQEEMNQLEKLITDGESGVLLTEAIAASSDSAKGNLSLIETEKKRLKILESHKRALERQAPTESYVGPTGLGFKATQSWLSREISKCENFIKDTERRAMDDFARKVRRGKELPQPIRDWVAFTEGTTESNRRAAAEGISRMRQDSQALRGVVCGKRQRIRECQGCVGLRPNELSFSHYASAVRGMREGLLEKINNLIAQLPRRLPSGGKAQWMAAKKAIEEAFEPRPDGTYDSAKISPAIGDLHFLVADGIRNFGSGTEQRDTLEQIGNWITENTGDLHTFGLMG
ncbi:MAG: hypothetical protein LBF24_01345 [Puniceicoccales bacterium]|jgi:hypothetical protein|nr:hypothetical protein [Puniceicoccales bacterium]